MKLLEGKTAIIFGVANKRSIAWAIAQTLHNAGARLALTYQGERIEENVRELAGTLKDPIILPCDVTKDYEIEQVFQDLSHSFEKLDILVHCVAFARKEELERDFHHTTREGFRIALDVSAYSLPAITKRALPLMEKKGGSVFALTYLGGYLVVPHYNVMGVAKAALETSIRYLAYELGESKIRVNGISAGPVNTLAARGITGFTKMLDVYRERSPLKRNISAAEVADTGLFLASDLSKGITGEIIYVDAGYHITGT
ncbi:MAG: enoyl-ACP reductase [Chlamydiae bacterium]|nr:enoyl-ACP reductase [Chlamydiota bacterium]MBI3266747.1 enoyl-ACP reductase [Chlamydiota bacterium]